MKYSFTFSRLMYVKQKIRIFWKGRCIVDKLVKQAIAGDKDAFTQLMEMNMSSMYKTAWVYLKNDVDIADAIQDTILACYEKLDTLRNVKYFKTWMTRILINKCNDILRSRVIGDIEIVSEEGQLDDQFDQVEWKLLLNSLDEKYSVILLLYYLDGLSTKEIARVLELKENTVLTRLRRGRHLLQNLYGDVKGEYA